ncbi:uncharacterized protein J4E88_008549 [Alternaria novae-zelandiae]|uniref:uncharacterized protein n=1 Tax=Alternaria novae-zelandiae TaxID=430562 RepID=UPI0020C59C11|nr:uncharacterized protein J4E88_008549 [Alternaria novae-zelandiae]KAI4674082.1 hypothetical protein J4E88_008549 [Alternaria novae-zelandiae]
MSSREIFRVLQRFGEISTFKYLRYEYQNPADNVALAIYRDEAAAQSALDASPLRFALEKLITSDADADAQIQAAEEDEDDTPIQQTPQKDGIDEILRPSQLLNRTLPTPTGTTGTSPAPTPPSKPLPFDPPPHTSSQKKSTKWFQVTVDRSRAVHPDFIERQPYWKQFHPMKSMAQVDLEKSVPHVGLSDVSKRPPNAYRTPARVLRVMNEYVEKRMPSLRGIVEGGENERGFEERRRRG